MSAVWSPIAVCTPPTAPKTSGLREKTSNATKPPRETPSMAVSATSVVAGMHWRGLPGRSDARNPVGIVIERDRRRRQLVHVRRDRTHEDEPAIRATRELRVDLNRTFAGQVSARAGYGRMAQVCVRLDEPVAGCSMRARRDPRCPFHRGRGRARAPEISRRPGGASAKGRARSAPTGRSPGTVICRMSRSSGDRAARPPPDRVRGLRRRAPRTPPKTCDG